MKTGEALKCNYFSCCCCFSSHIGLLIWHLDATEPIELISSKQVNGNSWETPLYPSSLVQQSERGWLGDGQRPFGDYWSKQKRLCHPERVLTYLLSFVSLPSSVLLLYPSHRAISLRSSSAKSRIWLTQQQLTDETSRSFYLSFIYYFYFFWRRVNWLCVVKSCASWPEPSSGLLDIV